jgi:Beta-ketoacyl synthase, N-terminal domain
MTAVHLGVKAWAAWAPSGEDETDWRVWSANRQPVDCSNSPPVAVMLPALLRRRVTQIGQNALHLAWYCEEIATTRLVFATRHGEFGRTLAILHDLAQDHGVSPAEFTFQCIMPLPGCCRSL